MNRGRFLTTLATVKSSPMILPKLPPTDKGLLKLPTANQLNVSKISVIKLTMITQRFPITKTINYIVLS